MTRPVALQWLERTAYWGGFVWLLVWVVFMNDPTFFNYAEVVQIFGVGVITPFAMRLALQTDLGMKLPAVYKIAVRLHPLVILSTAAALILEPGFWAALCASLWIVQTVLLALYGLHRLLPRPVFALEELCIDMALIYAPVSGIWLIAYCADYALFTFDAPLVLLTSVHFTYISLGALVIVGMMGRALYGTPAWRMYQYTASVILVSPMLIAGGITVMQFTGTVLLEVFSAVILVGSLWILCALFVVNALPTHPAARRYILLSLLAMVITMSLAVAYPVGRLTGWWSLSLLTMVQTHGWLNALGFTFLGLLAWTLDTPPPRVPSNRNPLIRLSYMLKRRK